MHLLAADSLGSAREGAAEQDLAPYERAFQMIDADPAHRLVVAMIGWAIQEARRRGCDLRL